MFSTLATNSSMPRPLAMCTSTLWNLPTGCDAHSRAASRGGGCTYRRGNRLRDTSAARPILEPPGQTVTLCGHDTRRPQLCGHDGSRLHVVPSVPPVPPPLVHVNLSPEAKAAWDSFTARHGFSMAAWLEVVGRNLDTAFAPKTFDRLVIEARELTHERRRAGGPAVHRVRRQRDVPAAGPRPARLDVRRHRVADGHGDPHGPRVTGARACGPGLPSPNVPALASKEGS